MMRISYFLGLLLLLPTVAQAECTKINTQVEYCSDTALLLGHAAPRDPEGVSGPMPNIRAWYSNETKPFTGTIILSIPVKVNPGAKVPAKDIIKLVMENTDAQGWSTAAFKNVKSKAASNYGWQGAVGEFTGTSLGLHTNYVIDAYLVENAIFALLTMDDRDTITNALRAQHRANTKNLRVKP